MEWIKKFSYLAINSSSAAIIIIDSNHKIRFANNSASEFFGLSIEKILDKDFHKLIHHSISGNHTRDECPIFSPLKTGQAINNRPDTFCDNKHRAVWISYSSTPLIENGKVEALFIDWHPFVLTSRGNDDMETIKATYKAVFNSSIDSIFIVNNNAKIIDANSAAVHFFDKPSLINKNFLRLFPLTHRPAATAFFEGVLKQKIQNTPLTVVGPDNVELHVEASSKSNIQPHRHLIIFHNITNQIQAQQRRDQFAAIISHEVKNPLAVIKAFTQLLQRRLKSTADIQTMDYLSKIDDKVNFVAGLIANLTDSIRLGTGQLNFRDEPVEFDDFISTTVKELQRTYPSHKLRIRGKSHAQLFIDRHRLNQVVSNLINNAVKYSPDAKMVSIHVSAKNNNAQLKVIDYGIGISTKTKSILYQPFTRGPESAEKFPGVGLGLYLSKSIISHYNGKIVFRSRSGKGSIFTVRLPINNPTLTHSLRNI